MLDCISGGRIISGFVRGTAVETLQGGIAPPQNRDRFEEAHDLIIRCWTEPGALPLRRRVLPLPEGQPLGSAHAEAPSAHLVPRIQQSGERRVGGAPRASLHEPGIAAGPHPPPAGRVHRHRPGDRVRARARALRLPAADLLRRHRREGPGNRPRVPSGPRSTATVALASTTTRPGTSPARRSTSSGRCPAPAASAG